jgi:hypothetical protein
MSSHQRSHDSKQKQAAKAPLVARREGAGRDVAALEAAPEQVWPGRDTSRPFAATEILALQRSIGNRAVQRILEARSLRPQQGPERSNPVPSRQEPTPATGQIQRLIPFAFTAKVGTVAAHGRPHDTAFLKLMKLHAKYKTATTTQDEYEHLNSLLREATEWQNQYKDKYPNSKKTKDVKDLMVVGWPEVHRLKQAVYMEKMELGSQRKDGGFEFLTSTGEKALKHSDEERKLAAQHRISQAELTAIKVYSAGDYEYINPTVGGDDERLEANAKKLAGPTITRDESGNEHKYPSQWKYKKWRSEVEQKGPSAEQKAKIKQEAKEHGDMAHQGLNKLPNWKGQVFRGMGVSENQIKREYAKGSPITYTSFTSTSSKEKTARDWAAKNATGGKVGLLLIMNVTRGKDITQFSEVKSEGEILLPPGATFTVDDVKHDNVPNSHQRMYIVTLKQAN